MRSKRVNVWFLLMLAMSALATGAPATADDWPRYGHDRALTGRSPLMGDIDSPRVAWTYSFAGRELLVELTPETGGHDLCLDADTKIEPGPHGIAPPAPPELDLDGSGVLRPVRESYHERWAKILPDTAGLQRVAWSHTWTDQKVCRLQLFAHEEGVDRPRLVWESDPAEGTIFQPLNIVFDIDGDGVLEVCVAAHYRVMIFEGTTGRKETELRYHSSRPYGWFGLGDVDADGQMELITIGDFQSHIDVLEFDPSRPEAERLSVKWRRDIEPNIEQRQKWPQVGPRPLADVTGDGRPEIVVNLFNDTGDSQWHAMALNATNGEAICDLPSRFIQGTADLDNNGKAELFTAQTNGPLVRSHGRIELVTLDRQTPTVRWSQDEAGWLSADLRQLGPTWSTTASQGMRTVLLGRGTRPVFLVSRRESGDTRTISLSVMRVSEESQLESLWEIGGIPEEMEAIALEATANEGGPRALVRVRLAAGMNAEASGRSVRPRIQQSRSIGIDVSMPIAARLQADARMSVIVEGPGHSIAAITVPGGDSDVATLRWSRPGRGMRDGSRTLGLLAADLDGDGAAEVVAADKAGAGHAVLVAYRGDGATLWRREFEQIPGALPVWNVGSLTFWWPGCFRQRDLLDLFVSTRRGLMHSDSGELVDGRNGATVWRHDRAVVPNEFRWGYTGIPLAVADIDADRRDDLVCIYPVCFWIANGRDGKIIVGKELASQTELPAWAAYGEPMVHDFNGDSQPDILLDSPYILALLDEAGNPLWHGLGRDDYPVRPDEGNVGQTTACKHALCDIDGDGTFEIASAGYGNGTRVIDPATGHVLWSLATPNPTGPRMAAVNIDGVGGDEIIYPAGNELVVVSGDRNSGRVLWTWPGPATLSLPAIADVDGDGLAEIVVQDAEATIHCLDAAP